MDSRTYKIGDIDVIVTDVNSQEAKDAADAAIKTISALLKKQDGPDSSFAVKYMSDLEKVASEYVKTITGCMATQKAQQAVTVTINNKDSNNFVSHTFPAARKEFQAVHEQYKKQLGDPSLSKVPKMDEDTKKKIPAHILSLVVDTRDKVVKIKKTGDILFDNVQAANKALVAFGKVVAEEIKKKQAANSGSSAPVHPIQQSSAQSVPMSSMYGAKQQASAAQAKAAANLQGGSPLPQSNPNAKK